jgi:hypothetical protein
MPWGITKDYRVCWVLESWTSGAVLKLTFTTTASSLTTAPLTATISVSSTSHTFKALSCHFEEGVTMTFSTSSALNHESLALLLPLCLHIPS